MNWSPYYDCHYHYYFLVTILALPSIFTLECGEFTSSILETRIIDGELAISGEFPWQVSLQRKVKIKLGNVNASDTELTFNEMMEERMQTTLWWQQLLRAKNFTEEEIRQWPHQLLPTQKFPFPTFPPNKIIPSLPTYPPSRFPPLPTFPPKTILPEKSSSFPSMPPLATLPKHWTHWTKHWSTSQMPSISRIPIWSTPKSPPIILPIPTTSPKPKPSPSPIPTSPNPLPDFPRKWQHFCGGSIINHYWVLTAAHCVESLKNVYTPGMIQIMAGSTNWRYPDNQYTQIIPVDRIVVHDGWRQYTAQNDIALLHLSRPISYVKQDKIYVNSVCLSKETEKEYQGIVSSSGWGFLAKDNRITPELLRRVDLVVVDHATCRNAFSRVIDISTNQVCAGGSLKGNCMGDSGGPLIQKHENKATQIGIVSFSIPCAIPGYPDVFTRVSKYIDWISQHTGLNFHLK